MKNNLFTHTDGKLYYLPLEDLMDDEYHEDFSHYDVADGHVYLNNQPVWVGTKPAISPRPLKRNEAREIGGAIYPKDYLVDGDEYEALYRKYGYRMGNIAMELYRRVLEKRAKETTQAEYRPRLTAKQKRENKIKANRHQVQKVKVTRWNLKSAKNSPTDPSLMQLLGLPRKAAASS